MIKIDFEMTDETGLYTYKDVLYLPEDNSFTDDEIELMKVERFNNWLSVILGTSSISIIEE